MNKGKPLIKRCLRRKGVKTSGRQELQGLTTLLKNRGQQDGKGEGRD
jgi:hypothetical protein